MFDCSRKSRQLALKRQQLLLDVQQQRLALFDDLSALQARAQPGAMFKDALWDLARLGKPAAYAGLLWLVRQRWLRTRAAKSGRIAGLIGTLWGAWQLGRRLSPWLDLLKPGGAAQRREEADGAGPVRPSM